MSETVQFPSASGGSASGVIAFPSAAKAPAIVLVQEYWGINAHIRSLVDRLAAAGFVALAPDLYRGVVAKTADEARKLMGGLDWGVALGEIGGAGKFLKDHPRGNGKVGLTGFCLGGALSFAAATKFEEFGAISPFYGIPDVTKFDWSAVNCPIQAHFSSRDPWAKAEIGEALAEKLAGLGKKMELRVYDADHAFVNDTRAEVFSPENAKKAWDAMIAFQRAELG